jgi:hypothetical protein
MPLTDTTLRTLKPKTGKTERLIADGSGLYIRVRAGEGKITRTWQFRRKDGARLEITTLGWSAFVTDRNALVDQTSAAMDLYGIDHGVMQATHWRCRPNALVQLVSAQTLGRRLGNGGYVDHHLRDLRFVLIDEAHTLYKGTTDWLSTLPGNVAVVG